ncbi:MAG: ABC transporter ATP-binding protein [Clostridia bacterium]|nr:ABC transporter ATP-binding protein [Clostridia bacterium]
MNYESKETLATRRKSWSYVKDFIPYYNPYKALLFFDLFFSLVAAGVDLIFPIFVTKIMDSAELTGYLMITTALKYAIILVALRIVEICCRFFISKYGHIMGVKIESDLRSNMFRHLQRLSNSFYDNQKVGSLMSRITTDLFEITEFSHHCPETLLIAGTRIIGIFIVLITVNAPMTLCFFVLIPIMAWLVVNFNNKWDNNYQENRVNMANINAQVEDTLAGIRVVKSFANEELEQSKFEKGNQAFVKSKSQTYHYMGTFVGSIRAMDAIMYISIIILGALFKISAVEFVMYLLYAASLLNSLVSFADYSEQFQKGITAFARYQQIIDTPIELADKVDAQDIGQVEGNIEFDNVTFAYKGTDRNVLNNLSFSVNKGQTVAIVGPSGGGKTTIANLIPRFYDCTGGRVMIDGKDVKDVKVSQLRQNIGVVAQDVYLFWGTVADNIEYGRVGASREEIIQAAKMAGVDDFIQSLPNGYDSYVGERGIKLSGGQKQRVSIARVFLKNPPILILDEATSSLDNESEVKIQRSLDQLAMGRTSIVIAHRLSTIRNADNIIVLTDKGIVETGTHDQLIKNNGLYKKLYDLSQRTESLTQFRDNKQ